MAKSNAVKAHFSPVSGSSVRRMYDSQGNFVGLITKLVEGGYRVQRFPDQKTRVKKTLAQAYASIARVN
jgi:hypothetical protein